MRRLLVLFALSSRLLFADYGWLPPANHLYIHSGFDYFSTSQNFMSDGSLSNNVYQNNAVALKEVKFHIEPEFSFSEDWAARLRLELIGGTVTPTNIAGASSVLSRFGLGDIVLGLKKNLVKAKPSLTLEITVKIPTYSTLITDLTTVLPGDGNLDIGGWLHLGYSYHKFFFDFSPGLIGRFSGYASALALRTAIGGRFTNSYVYLFTDSLFSLGDALLFDSSINNHSLSYGSGGSYALLSGSPSGTDVGIRAGVKVIQGWNFEAYAKGSIIGRRYPEYYQIGANVLVMTDLSVEDTRPKLHDIPFETPSGVIPPLPDAPTETPIPPATTD